jgi:spore coat protein A
MELTRREFTRLAAAASAGIYGLWITACTASARAPLAKYVDALPALPLALPQKSGYPGDYYELTMRQQLWQFHRDLPATHAWGYWASNPAKPASPIGLGYLGPLFVAHQNRPVVVKYRNQLPATHLLQSSIDVTLWKNVPGIPPDPPGGRMPQDFPNGMSVWNVVHLHGGFGPPQSDGSPEAWFTPFAPSGVHHGPKYVSLPGALANEAIYAYTNYQAATMLWYHDHAMAITRLNIYAGLAGVYLIRDKFEEALNLPGGDFEVPLVLQDRTFNPDGSLFYPTTGPSPYHPKWQPNFLAQTPIVNGKAYPFLAVEPRRYRLRFLNGSNQRFFHMWFQDTNSSTRRPFWLVGTDGGFRAAPLKLTSIVLPPAARIDVILDLTGVPHGTQIILRNEGTTPVPEGGPKVPIREIMRLEVTKPLSSPDRTAPPGELILRPITPLKPTPGLPRREFVLVANKDKAGKPTHLAINQHFFTDPVEEFPKVATTEIWEYINTSAAAHPMHVHLVQFQILNRQKFNAASYLNAYLKWVSGGRNPATKPRLANYLMGDVQPPAPEETGRKDIVIAYPGMVSRIVLNFSVPKPIPRIPGTAVRFPAEYIHHCHMLEHEDNEKMRPWQVIA